MPVRPKELARRSVSASAITVHPVSRRVNKIEHDGADLVGPAELTNPRSEQLNVLEASPPVPDLAMRGAGGKFARYARAHYGPPQDTLHVERVDLRTGQQPQWRQEY